MFRPTAPSPWRRNNRSSDESTEAYTQTPTHSKTRQWVWSDGGQRHSQPSDPPDDKEGNPPDYRLPFSEDGNWVIVSKLSPPRCHHRHTRAHLRSQYRMDRKRFLQRFTHTDLHLALTSPHTLRSKYRKHTQTCSHTCMHARAIKVKFDLSLKGCHSSVYLV